VGLVVVVVVVAVVSYTLVKNQKIEKEKPKKDLCICCDVTYGIFVVGRKAGRVHVHVSPALTLVVVVLVILFLFRPKI